MNAVANTPDLSIIIASYSTSEVTRNCIRSILSMTTDISFEIIVVDDCSTDNSVAEIASEFPEVRVLVNPVNLHYAKTNNRGLMDCKGRYACLLNSDTLLRNNAFKLLVEYLDSNPSVGAVGPKLINPDGSTQYCVRSFASPWVMFLQAINLQKIWPNNPITEKYYQLNRDYDSTFFVESLGTTAFVIRREVWESCGLLDERFKIAFVDLAFCAKLRSNNVKISYLGSAVVEHLGSQSINLNSEREVRERAAGLRIFYDNYLSYRDSRIKQFAIRIGIHAWGVLRRIEHKVSSDKRVITGPGAPKQR